MNKTLSLLTICRKAGKLVLGMDPVKDCCRNGEARCVLVAEDVSAKSQKEIMFAAGQELVKVYRLDATIDDVWSCLGKKAGILAVTDNGFYKKLSTMLSRIDKE